MVPTRTSLAGLLSAIAGLAVGLTCLLHASSPLASLPFSAFLAFLALTPLAIAYRRGEGRAFWVGAAIGGWSYMLLGFGPWPFEYFRPRLVSFRVLAWAYPLAIPEARQANLARPVPFRISSPTHGLDIDTNTISLGTLDVLLGGGSTGPSLLVEGVSVGGHGTSGSTITEVTVMTDPTQNAKLAQAMATGAEFSIRRHAEGASDLLATIRLSPPVEVGDFEHVGHVLFGAACALAGGWAGRYFYSTRGQTTISTGDPARGR